ncbi:aminopeptidase N-like isoform X2 [Anopheles albimanus]|nr:aminopeptidase N-like isoform X2 [Anopheles albimanus]XP_035776635.1 aminopeptidase N-like isoform X2 [Anopheles albimanus]
MDTSGHINEGGPMKSKNGQKYTINQQPRGRYCSNTMLAVFGVLFSLLLLTTVTLLLVMLLQPASQDCSLLDTTTRAPSDPRLNTNRYWGAHEKPHPSILNDDDDYAQADSRRNGLAGPDDHALDASGPGADWMDEPDDETERNRLTQSSGWLPVHYRLIIEPNIERSLINGTVTINIKPNPSWVKASNQRIPPIVLDVNEIRILSCEVLSPASSKPITFKAYYGANNLSYLIEPDLGRLAAGNLSVELQFESRLSDTLQGFYRGYFPDDEEPGGRSWFASTQFSPIDARRAFPCFDSPDKKATFAISIVHSNDRAMTLSNMEQIGHQYDVGRAPDYVREDFAITPRMSTYLVAFITSNLQLAQRSEGFRPIVNVWTRDEVRQQGSYVHRLTMRLLPFLEAYFGMPYNLAKLDLVAVPDFGFRAMENWGLITFRESALLVPEDDNRSSSAKHMEAVASVVAHELVHQWFGNLVTPRWWNDLWLKEGFATYISYVALNVNEKRWHMFESFVQKELQEAFEKDSDRNSHPISFPVNTASDIRRIFDPISYSKGAAIVRMMDCFLGDIAFKRGIHEYLQKYQYDNAEQDDLWDILTVEGHRAGTLPTDLDVKQIMETWTLQPGYPVITFERNGTELTISQQRYLLPSRNSSDDTRWYIPLTIVTESHRAYDPIKVHWFPYENATIQLQVEVESDEYFFANADRTGYYRVNYDYVSWKKLTSNFAKLPPLTRMQLVDDAFQLARAEFIQYDIPLTLILVVTQQYRDIPAWAALSRSLVYINNMMSREPAYEALLAVMRSTLRPAFDAVGFEDHADDSHQDMIHRERVVNLACHYGIDKCSVQAQTLFRRWMTNYQDNRIPPSLKETIYCTSLRDGGVPEWNFAFKRYQDTDSASEKEIILNALGCTVKPWLLSKYLNMTINPASGILKQDGVRAFQAVATNFAGSDIAFNFLYENIAEINAYYGDGFSTLSKMIDSATLLMNKPHHKERFDRFAYKAKQLGLPTIEKTIRLAKEQILNNIYWRSRSYHQLQHFLVQLINDLNFNMY